MLGLCGCWIFIIFELIGIWCLIWILYCLELFGRLNLWWVCFLVGIVLFWKCCGEIIVMIFLCVCVCSCVCFVCWFVFLLDVNLRVLLNDKIGRWGGEELKGVWWLSCLVWSKSRKKIVWMEDLLISKVLVNCEFRKVFLNYFFMFLCVVLNFVMLVEFFVCVLC